MAFHVACPITCRKICFCLLGFPQNFHGKEVKDVFLDEIHSLEKFLPDPWDAGVSKEGTVQIHVPKLAVFDTGPHIVARDVVDDSAKEVAESSISRQGKHTVVLKRAVQNHADDFEVAVNELSEEDDDNNSASITCPM